MEKPFCFCLEFTFHLLLLTLAFCQVTGEDYLPTVNILLSCGGPPESIDTDGRTWYSDMGSKFNYVNNNASITSRANVQDPSVPEVPYMDARIFQSQYTYNFPVVSGRVFIRLYFYSASYNGLDASNAVFSVTAGPYTLMKNFSLTQTTEVLKIVNIKKEFSVYVESQMLNLTFTPANSHGKNSNFYAFVNGIEVVSHPDIYGPEDGRTFIVGQNSASFYICNGTAMENLYRLNVGGGQISPTGDTGMFRLWQLDGVYIYGAATGVTSAADPNVTIAFPPGTSSYLAPLDVYTTFRAMGPTTEVNMNYNLTWIFSVDSGFFYLVRLHFCEALSQIRLVNEIVFDIFIHNMTAESLFDIISAGGDKNGIPVYRDYVVHVAPIDGQPQQDMWVALHPNIDSRPRYYNALLNGLEIFKLNDSSGNLGGSNPRNLSPPAPNSVCSSCKKHSKNQKKIVIGVGIPFVIFISGLLVFAATFFHRRRRIHRSKDHFNTKIFAAGSSKENSPNSVGNKPCHHFSLSEIKLATNDFDEALLLGVGGFGRVYRGIINGGRVAKTVAIKRGGSSLSRQGVNEFQNEIDILSQLRHRHLVSLIGCCQEDDEMILVYDYMANGTLREHLYKSDKPPLPWKQRLEIAIGAARGLHYLHTGAKHTIVHRDIKTTNILLDEKWVAKVSDFGLSKTGPPLDTSHVSTEVKGTFGYLDPEYFRWRKLTRRSDVYSFGVVLFEILTARPAVVEPTPEEEAVGLAGWARQWYEKGSLHEIMDPYLMGKIGVECFEKIAETAAKCVAESGTTRPSIGDVLRNLELALQLQETAEEDHMSAAGDGVGEERDRADNDPEAGEIAEPDGVTMSAI